MNAPWDGSKMRSNSGENHSGAYCAIAWFTGLIPRGNVVGGGVKTHAEAIEITEHRENCGTKANQKVG